MTGKKLAGVILIFSSVLGLIITFNVTFALLFTSCFGCWSPNGCDGMNAIIAVLKRGEVCPMPVGPMPYAR